jgi:hypothetical protein
MAEFGDYLIYNLEKGKVMEANVGNEMTYWTTITKGQFGDVKATFRQSLTYSGKQGSIVRFVYRERSTGYEGYARPALNQDLTYDIAIDYVSEHEDKSHGSHERCHQVHCVEFARVPV